eukprot:11502911-Alexandrium_andersonii.AAC.1
MTLDWPKLSKSTGRRSAFVPPMTRVAAELYGPSASPHCCTRTCASPGRRNSPTRARTATGRTCHGRSSRWRRRPQC